MSFAVLSLLLALAPLQPGDRAPLVDLVGLDGRVVALDSPGQVTVVDFFATWCPQCRRSVDDYRKLAATHGDRLRILIIDVEEPPALVRNFFARHPLAAGVALALDLRGRAMRSFGAHGFPSYFVIDQSGVIRQAGSGWGAGTADTLDRSIRALLDPAQGGRRMATRARPERGRSRKQPAPQPAGTSADERARRMGVEILH